MSVLLSMFMLWAPFAMAQAPRPVAAPPDLSGVYQAIPSGTTLPGSLRNTGSPEDIALVPAAVQQMKAVDLKQDPEKMCQPIGPFRMMAREGTKIELVPALERTWLNDAGAQHSDALHLVERIRPILEGKYLEYRVTAEDPKALTKPYTYVRYYEKLKTEIMQDVCEE